MKQHDTHGFSLVEMAMVMAIAIIASSVCFVALRPALQQIRVTNAYNATLSTLRQAHDSAVAQRWKYLVTFSNAAVPNTITVNQTTDCSTASTQLVKTQLPNEVTFKVVSGVPTSPNGTYTTPDGFGTASFAIDFDQGVNGGGSTQVCFYPDGSAHDKNGNVNSGVVYMAGPVGLYSSRAITVWGVTGRLRGFRLYKTAGTGGSVYWRQQ
ncbi:MAG TPA: prepilin-type N-terminal cleavage/methylation domain-containing protein [Terriglobales bacterium]|nr:prepilin-type N-terminal cleavage/methylation domain-containing protein [Terriglobales bacterium]